MTLSQSVRIEFGSAFDMLDFVQVVSDHLSRMIGFDEDALQDISVAVRESAVNAIKHGNKNDPTKRVVVEFTPQLSTNPPRLLVRVVDQGEGFDPDEVPDPLAPENILKSSGRGLLIVRNFMDDVSIRRAPDGGMEVRLVKNMATPRS